MKIALKRDWDMQISPPFKDEILKGHYGGREKEVNMLTNELLRERKGSILISGYRGVGKTSLVYRALWNIQDSNENNILILLNASQFENNISKDEIEPKNIIENLIRRLFSTVNYENSCLDTSLRDKIERLYRKAVASNFEKLESSTSQREYLQEDGIEERIEIAINEKNLVFIGSWSLALILQLTPIFPWEAINKILPMLFAFPIPYSINILHRNQKILKNIKSDKNNIEEIYKFDNNLGNLEFDLEKLHREISRNGKKIIYIIDELDKLDSKYTEKILNYFKNFFTYSNAIFIFIGGEEIYDPIPLKKNINQNDILYRNRNYTYFTSKYFLSRPLWEDLKGFLNSIIDQIVEEDKSQLEILMRALCFESKNDFFDIKYYIKDRINFFDKEDRPIIDVILSYEDLQKARYHKILTILFEEKYMLLGPSRWRENELLFRYLFDHAYKIRSMYAGDLVEDSIENDPKNEMLRDFNKFMYRIEAFEVERTERKLSSHQKKSDVPDYIDVLVYRYTGYIPNEPPCHFNLPTEFEIRFINIYKELYKYVLALMNSLRLAMNCEAITDDEFLESLNAYEKEREIISDSIFNTLTSYSLDFMTLSRKANEYIKRRNETEENIKRIESQLVALKRTLPRIVSNMIKNLFSDIDNLSSLKDNNNYFTILDKTQRSDLKNSYVLITKDQSRQLIFLSDQNQFNKIAKELNSNLSTHRAILFLEKSNNLAISDGFIVIYESPELLNSSLNKLFKNLKVFYSIKTIHGCLENI